jgi:hypothetical protein
LKLLGFALLVKHLDGLQPPCLRRSVQFPQLAQSSLAALGFKRVGLHYIALSELAIAKTRLVLLPTSKIAEFGTSATNLG